MNREELKQCIAEKEKIIRQYDEELYELRDEYDSKYVSEDLKKQYLNKFFIYKDNCYSCPEKPEDYWNIYYYIDKIEGTTFNCIIIEKDKYGEIKIRRDHRIFSMMQSLIEITKKEFLINFNNIVMEILDIRNQIN
jgi:hypothetical protein